MIHTLCNKDIEPIPNILVGEGFTETYYKMVKLRISDSEISWTLKVQENIYLEYLKQLMPCMTASEKMVLVTKVSSEFKNNLQENNQQMEKQVKPDWITDEQWKAVPSIGWWEDRKQGAEYIKQSKPRTTQEVQAQFSRLRSEKSWKQGE